MSNEEMTATGKVVDDTFIASIHFRGQYEEIPEYFGRLYEHVKPYVRGRALCLFHGRAPEGGHHLEVCYPVSQAVDSGQINSRILEGGPYLAAPHSGPYDSPGAIWGGLSDYMDKHQIEIASGPLRLVYMGERDERRDSTEEYVAELQAPLLLPRWLDRLADGLDRFAGETVRRQVMKGSEGLTLGSSPREKAEWVKGAMKRLDAAVGEEETRKTIVTGCAHRFPAWRIEQMRAEFERLGNIDELLVLMRLDQSVDGLSWYEYPERVGNTLYQAKNPYDPEKYVQATDKAERRAYYCHCGLIRAAIQAGDPVSGTHCYCGAAWPKQLWEGILGKPVRVEIAQSVLQGDDCCRFAIHLPE